MNSNLNDVKKLLSRQLYGILATSGEKTPYMNLVAFCLLENMKTLLFISPEKSAKVYNIKSSPGIALMVDNRTNTYDDITSVTSVTMYGTASVPEESEDASDWLEIYNRKLPHMKNFAADKSNVLVKVDIDNIHIVRDLHNVTVIDTSQI